VFVTKRGLEIAEKREGVTKKGLTKARKRDREREIARERSGRKRERERERREREREREREKQADRVELERVMIVTTVVRTNEHLGTAFGIFQVSSNAQRRVALYCGNVRFNISV